MSGGTPKSSDEDDAMSSASSTPNADAPDSGEPRSSDKLAQIDAFAQKYGITIDAVNDTASSLNLDDAKLDDIQVQVQTPKLLYFNNKGDRVSEQEALRNQKIEFDRRIREARVRVVRAEFGQLLRSPDFLYLNNDINNLVTNDAARSSNDDIPPAAAPVVPTPAEQQLGVWNLAKLPEKMPTGFDPSVLQSVFDDLRLPSGATDKEYINILEQRIARFRGLLKALEGYNDYITTLLKGPDTTDDIREDLVFTRRMNHLYLGSINTNLEYLKSLTKSRRSKADIRAANTNLTMSSARNNNNNNNIGGSVAARAPQVLPMLSESLPDYDNLSKSARRRRRENQASDNNDYNYNYNSKADSSSTGSAARDANGNDVRASANNHDDSGSDSSNHNNNDAGDDRVARAEEEYQRNRGLYNRPDGRAAASRTAEIVATANELRAKSKEVCLSLHFLLRFCVLLAISTARPAPLSFRKVPIIVKVKVIELKIRRNRILILNMNLIILMTSC